MTDVPATPRVTLDDITAGLERLGLRAGDKVRVHSSLKSFGQVEGGPQTVILALQRVLTPAGILMLPSFNHNRPFLPGRAGVYDPTHTPTANGAIPDAFWRMPGVLRSLNPTHPFAAWGNDARRFVEHHHLTLTMGADSPLGMLEREGGYGLLLGVGYKANTFHHVVEMTLNVPCLGKRTESYPVRLPDGRLVHHRTWGWRDAACPINDVAAYAPLMAPYESRTTIGRCDATLFRLSDARTVISRALREGLNGAPPCSRCPIRPRITPSTVPSDWEANEQP